MYLNKRMQKMILNLIQKKNYSVYVIKLKTGVYSNDEAELADYVDKMFIAWGRIVRNKNKNYLRNYSGIMRRLFFEYSESKGGYEPFFYLFCLREKSILNTEEEYKKIIEMEKIRVQTYIKWFSSWASALRICTPVSVSFSLVEIENIEAVLSKFCTNEKYTLLPLIEEAKKELLKRAAGNGRHKLFNFSGVFIDLNRQLSVER
ncbi:MAG: hypothetical protein K6C98_02715 [Treponema sp.]|nr:hypothetical protein [Treponema sp.]